MAIVLKILKNGPDVSRLDTFCDLVRKYSAEDLAPSEEDIEILHCVQSDSFNTVNMIYQETNQSKDITLSSFLFTILRISRYKERNLSTQEVIKLLRYVFDILERWLLGNQKLSAPGFLVRLFAIFRNDIRMGRVSRYFISVITRELVMNETRETINELGENAFSCLHMAVIYDQLKTVKHLLTHPGIDVNLKSGEGQTAISMSINSAIADSITAVLLNDTRLDLSLCYDSIKIRWIEADEQDLLRYLLSHCGEEMSPIPMIYELNSKSGTISDEILISLGLAVSSMDTFSSSREQTEAVLQCLLDWLHKFKADENNSFFGTCAISLLAHVCYKLSEKDLITTLDSIFSVLEVRKEWFNGLLHNWAMGVFRLWHRITSSSNFNCSVLYKDDKTLAECYIDDSDAFKFNKLCQIPGFNPNQRDRDSNTLLMRISRGELTNDRLLMARYLLSHENTYVSLKNKCQKTALDFIIENVLNFERTFDEQLNDDNEHVNNADSSVDLVHTNGKLSDEDGNYHSSSVYSSSASLQTYELVYTSSEDDSNSEDESEVSPLTRVLCILTVIIQHPTVTKSMISGVFTELFPLIPSVNLDYLPVIHILTGHEHFSINQCCITRDSFMSVGKYLLENIISVRYSWKISLDILQKCIYHDKFDGKLIMNCLDWIMEMEDREQGIPSKIQVTLKYLLQNGKFSINRDRNSFGQTAAHVAAIRRKFTVLGHICERVDLDPSIEDGEGCRFLYHLIEKDIDFKEVVIPIMNILLNKNTSINSAIDSTQQTIAHKYGCLKCASNFKAVINVETYNPNVPDSSGNSILITMVMLLTDGNFDDETVEIIKAVLSLDNTDVSKSNKSGKSALGYLVEQPQVVQQQDTILQLLNLVIKHRTFTADLACLCFSGLLRWSNLPETLELVFIRNVGLALDIPGFFIDKCDVSPSNLLCITNTCCKYLKQSAMAKAIITQLCTTRKEDVLITLSKQLIDTFDQQPDVSGRISKYLVTIARNPTFNINMILNEGNKTLAHICATRKMIRVLTVICKSASFNPNIKDGDGKTVLFYICEKLSVEDADPFIMEMGINWNFGLTDKLGQTVIEAYKKMENSDEYILEMLKMANRGRNAFPSSRARADTQYNLKRDIVLKPSSDQKGFKPVSACGYDFYQSKVSDLENEQIYDLSKARKGRACIISVPEFTSPLLKPLTGYREDEKLLSTTLTELGFDVVTAEPKTLPHVCLTAWEMEDALDGFVSMLTSDDDCCVLVVLSHGKQGSIYGSDGSQLSLNKILTKFNNINCTIMVGKPKVVIVQACQGDQLDYGQMAAAVSEDAGSAPDIHVPSLSDMIVCYSVISGYASYVINQGNIGSVFIKNLMKIFNEKAKDCEINEMLVKVNKQMSKETVAVENATKTRTDAAKQMPHYDSSLTKSFYFFPASGGKTGKDWKVRATEQDLVD